MKVTGFRVEQYLMKLDRPVGDCNLPSGFEILPGSLLFLETDENITGISPGWGFGIEGLFELVEGRDPREVHNLWIDMNDYLHKFGNTGVVNAAMGTIDVALWDLKAKLADEPLWRTLGATEGRVKAYASGLDYCLSDEDLFSFYRGMAEMGIDSGKLKVGLDLKADMRRLAIMQDALRYASPNPCLMIDANEYWSPKQAVRQVRKIEEKFDLFCVEEPARRWDYDGLRQVSRQVRAAVSTGENLRTLSDFYPLVANQAVDIVSVSSTQTGITGCRQIANLALAFDLPVSMMNCQANFMAQVAAAMPNHTMIEVIGVNREHCLKFSSYIEDGHVILGQEPGLGIEVDQKKLSELQKCPPEGKGRFPFPRRAGAGRYIVPPEPGEVPWQSGE